jgi:hypothetical protein|tara:strand:+ start:473 stop:1159 length:687 start_codon:yes stop_codon:yes gene_type:complete
MYKTKELFTSNENTIEEPSLDIKPIEEIKTEINPSKIYQLNDLDETLSVIDDAPSSNLDTEPIEDEIFEKEKKPKKKKKPSEKQLAHLERIRAKSLMARRAKKKARDKEREIKLLAKMEKRRLKEEARLAKEKKETELIERVNALDENIIMKSADSNIDYDLLTNKIFEKFKDSNLFFKKEKPITEVKPIEKVAVKKVSVKKILRNKRHEHILKYYNQQQNRRKKGWS